MEIDNSNSNSSFSNSCQIISIDDSESNDSNGTEVEIHESSKRVKKNSKPDFFSAQESTKTNEQSEDQVTHELKKLSFDQNGTFMNDFNPEKSKREMRKMNRRLYIKDSKKSQLYDERGIYLENSMDLCDCLDKDCPGCHLSCPKCSSKKCGKDCRCNRKYIVEIIEIEGIDKVYSFPE